MGNVYLYTIFVNIIDKGKKILSFKGIYIEIESLKVQAKL